MALTLFKKGWTAALFWSSRVLFVDCCYRVGPSPGGSKALDFRADETELLQAGELCVGYPLLFGKTLLFVLGSMEHMGPASIEGEVCGRGNCNLREVRLIESLSGGVPFR